MTRRVLRRHLTVRGVDVVCHRLTETKWEVWYDNDFENDFLGIVERDGRTWSFDPFGMGMPVPHPFGTMRDAVAALTIED